MNSLAIDFGTKNIGLAIAISDIISPFSVVKNNKEVFLNIKKIISDYKIEKVFIGISEGDMALASKKFAANLEEMIQLPIETVEEAVSTIEANQIYLDNKHKKKDYKKNIDSVAAAVILRRALS